MPPLHRFINDDRPAIARRAARRFSIFLQRELQRGDLTPELTFTYRAQLEVAVRSAGDDLPGRGHSADVARVAIELDRDRVPGEICCITPDADVPGRWITVATYDQEELADAFVSGWGSRGLQLEQAG